VSNVGRLRVPLRTMISLLYLKHTFNESDEGVVERIPLHTTHSA